MEEKKLKIIFIILALAMLFAMLLISRDAGISGDEEVHYKQSEMVYHYFSSLGADQSSLDTPQTHLKYYGQSFDNLVTIFIHWFGIEDIYGFRHLMCSISGWLAIFVTALFAVYISGYGAAILVLLLFAVSPTFLGHAQNNLKDVPFALAYISSIYGQQTCQKRHFTADTKHRFIGWNTGRWNSGHFLPRLFHVPEIYSGWDSAEKV